MEAVAIHNTYEELAGVCDRQQESRQRDIFLVLAADAAFRAGCRDEAERLRLRLLALSPHSLFRPFDSFADALQSSDIEDYLADLRRQFPPEQAVKLLHGDNGTSGKSSAPSARRISGSIAAKRSSRWSTTSSSKSRESLSKTSKVARQPRP